MTNYHPDVQRAYSSHCADAYVVPDDETAPATGLDGAVSDETGSQAVGDGDAGVCGSCGGPAPYTITLHGRQVPVCLRHLNHWQTPAFNYTCPTVCVEKNHPGYEHEAWLTGSPAPFQPGQSHPDWRQWATDQLAAKDEEIARLAEHYLRATRRTRERTGERDRARDTAAALEAEVARLSEALREVRRQAVGARNPALADFIDRALSDTTGEATR